MNSYVVLVLQQLRRHGDIIQRTVGGYYIVQGRADDTMNLGGIKVDPPISNVFNSLLSPLNFMKLNKYCSSYKQTSSVEIERICNRADEALLETAAVSIKPAGGGPEQLAILAVLKDRSPPCDANVLKSKFQRAIQKNLNPLFKVRVTTYSFLMLRSDSEMCTRVPRSLESLFVILTGELCQNSSWVPKNSFKQAAKKSTEGSAEQRTLESQQAMTDVTYSTRTTTTTTIVDFSPKQGRDEEPYEQWG